MLEHCLLIFVPLDLNSGRTVRYKQAASQLTPATATAHYGMPVCAQASTEIYCLASGLILASGQSRQTFAHPATVPCCINPRVLSFAVGEDRAVAWLGHCHVLCWQRCPCCLVHPPGRCCQDAPAGLYSCQCVCVCLCVCVCACA